MATSRVVISDIVSGVSLTEAEGAYLRYVAHPAVLLEVAQAVIRRPTASSSSGFVGIMNSLQIVLSLGTLL